MSKIAHILCYFLLLLLRDVFKYCLLLCSQFRFWAELKEKLVACRSYKAPHCAPVLLQHVGGKERVKSKAPGGSMMVNTIS